MISYYLGDGRVGHRPAANREVALQVGEQRGGTLVAIFGLGRERLGADASQLRIQVGRYRAQRRNVVTEQLSNDLCLPLVGPHATLSQELPQDHAHGENVGSPVELDAADLFGGHVAELALDHAGARLVRLPFRTSRFRSRAA